MQMPQHDSLLLSKFDVAERQLAQAIRLFFEGGDPVSVHTLAEAALQILHDIRDSFGGKSFFRDDERIRKEKKAEWLAILSTSKNFFKHADRDPNARHVFKEEFNHYSLMDAVNLYLTAKKAWTPESIVFFQWFVITYPTVLHEDAPFGAVFEEYRRTAPAQDHERRALAARAIREFRAGERVPAGVSLAWGLSK